MAFSIDKLIYDNLLIKNLEALEISGYVLDIMTGKTATLTTGDMRVDKFCAGQTMHQIDALQINFELFSFIQQVIILNSDARMEMDDKEHKYVPCGSPVEVALLKFLTSNNQSVQDLLIRRERDYKLLTMIPFSSTRKRMTVAYQIQYGDENTVRIVVKGAPEYIIPLCITQLDDSNN